MIKQKISLVSMGNGEEYALPQSNTSDVYTVPSAISSNSHQRTQSQNRDECEETSKDHWVACDQCQKWRRVSFAVLKNIEASEQRWFCKDNTDDPLLSFCAAEEEVDHAEKGGVDVSLEVPRPAWVLALEEAYTHALAAQLSPSVYKDCDSLAYIKSLVRNAVGLISPPNTKWSEFLQRMDGCRGASQIHAQLRMVIFGCRRTEGPLPAFATPVPQQVPRHKPLPVLTDVAEVVPPLFIVPDVSGSGCGKAPYVQSHAQRPLQVLHSQVEAINVDLDTSVNEALLQKAVSEEHWRCSEQWRAWHRLQYQKQQLLVQQQQGGDFIPEWRTQAGVPAQSPPAIGYTNLQQWDTLRPQNYSDASLFFLQQNPSVVNQPMINTGTPIPNLAETTLAHPNEHRGLVPRAPFNAH